MKHLWYLMSLGEINNKSVRKTKIENIVKQKLVQKYYLLKDKEVYILTATEIEDEKFLTRDTKTISDELQQVLHGVGCQYANKTIKSRSALRYARRVIARVNKE